MISKEQAMASKIKAQEVSNSIFQTKRVENTKKFLYIIKNEFKKQ